VSGETAAIGLGFLLAGPVGAIIGGAALPVLAAATMWRARRREHDENTNNQANGTGSDSAKAGRDRSGSGSGGGGRGNAGGGGNDGRGRHHSPNGPGSTQHKLPKGPGSGKGIGSGKDLRSGEGLGSGGAKNRKPKVKDPVADKLAKISKDLADKFKNRPKNSSKDRPGKHDKTPTDGKGSAGTGGKGGKDAQDHKNPKKPKARKDHSSRYPDDRRWRGRGHKDKPEKTKKDQQRKNSKGGDVTSITSPDGLDPNRPNNGDSTHDEIIDAEIIDDGIPPKPDQAPDDVIDGEVVDEDRIALVKATREKKLRRQALKAGQRAAQDAARDGTQGDPVKVKLERIRAENHRIDLELHRQNQLLALAAATEQRRSTPVNYPAIQAAPAGTRTAEVAIARQIDFRTSTAYALLRAMADQLAHGLHNDADADMADHVIELAGIPAMCRNLAVAVREAAAALQKTAPLHPSVIKHLNNAAVAALTAARMADAIIVVFVAAHREDIIRVLDPRIGEERWNLRNSPGTLDAAKLRTALASAHSQRLALPAGPASSSTTASSGGSKLVPASDASTKKLITLMKGFTRGHMVNVLSEIAGAAAGVEAVADSVTKLYHRMAKTWPTENAVDDTVRATASKVLAVSTELRKAIKAAQRAHQRELRLNAKPRKGAHAEKKWDVAGRRPSS
jgi:hypothetical protein